MPSCCGTERKSREHACLGLPDALTLEWEQGNHTPSPGAELRQGKGFGVQFSGVVSAILLYEQMRRGDAHPYAKSFDIGAGDIIKVATS